MCLTTIGCKSPFHNGRKKKEQKRILLNQRQVQMKPLFRDTSQEQKTLELKARSSEMKPVVLESSSSIRRYQDNMVGVGKTTLAKYTTMMLTVKHFFVLKAWFLFLKKLMLLGTWKQYCYHGWVPSLVMPISWIHYKWDWKEIFIVLDDIWNENYLWESNGSLQYFFWSTRLFRK